MELIGTRARDVGSLLASLAESLLLPLAVIVGLTGGAMIGAEIARLQAPVEQPFH
ncbi:MAG: hypothetical protein N2422_00195 [Rhodobacteraceae bacterium]|nr:hypothetical protein [Paracoccaceae bacterium]